MADLSIRRGNDPPSTIITEVTLMLTPVRIIQIGAGGTGSWFARTFMHNLAEVHSNNKHDDARQIDWVIYDPDTVENRNLVRQPFYGGIKANKAEYLGNLIDHTLNFLKVPHIQIEFGQDLVLDLEKYRSKFSAITVVVCCVDNTLSRSNYEKFLLSDVVQEDKDHMFVWLNMGVSPEGDWCVELLNASLMKKTPYEKLTYPDTMIGCADREETGPVPQSTFSNVMSGAVAAQALTEFLATPYGQMQDYMKIIYGDAKPNVEVMPEEVYYQERFESNYTTERIDASKEEIQPVGEEREPQTDDVQEGGVDRERSGTGNNTGASDNGADEDNKSGQDLHAGEPGNEPDSASP